MDGWAHGSFCHPINIPKVATLLRDFLVDDALKRVGSVDDHAVITVDGRRSRMKGSASELMLAALARHATTV